MDLENIKNSTKESIIQNFMENVKHARRGPEHQRPKSWSKGTKSGSDKKKMRREGKDSAREMNESVYNILKRKLVEQSPVVPSYEGDPELEADKIAGIESSLSPAERDPFHLLSQQDREEVHSTLKKNPGPNGKQLLFRSGMRQLRTIADMAANTKTYGDDPKALHRIVQLADYMEKAASEHDDQQADSAGGSIPF